jgi:hypothetical protein
MIVEFPVEAFAAAEKRTGTLEPAAMLKGLTGLETMPEGRPERVTCTEPVKRLSGLMDKLTDWLVAP